MRAVPPSSPPSDVSTTFSTGDVVVYASHGIGHVEPTRPGGVDPEALTVSFASGLTVTLPLARAVEALRPLATEPELVDVQSTLRAETATSAEPWSRRHRLTREKVTSGRVTELAEVVRDGVQRERRAANGGGTAAPSDRQLYLQARTLLTAEIALCRGIEPAEADAWILAQVGGQSTEE